MWEQFSMRPDTTRETDRRPTDTSAEVGEVGDTKTRTNAEVGETETQPTDTNVEVGEAGEAETRPVDTNVEVGGSWGNRNATNGYECGSCGH
jgi:hypothetical protein